MIGENETEDVTEEFHMNLVEQRRRVNDSTIETNANKAAPMKPLTPLQSSATIVNLVLATGPFTYP